MTDDEDAQAVIDFLKARGDELDQPLAKNATDVERASRGFALQEQWGIELQLGTYKMAVASTSTASLELRQELLDMLKLSACLYKDHPGFKQSWLAGAERARSVG